MRFLICLTGLLLVAGPAAPGAWPREKGQIFFSFKGIVQAEYADPGTPIATMSTIYAEYGLAKNRTLGFDGLVDQDLNYSALIFLRFPLAWSNAESKFAYHIGAGFENQGGAVFQLGAAWAKGFETSIGSGWIAVDSSARLRSDAGDHVLKTDVTFGINNGPRSKIMLQLQAGRYGENEPYLKLAPTYARKIGDGRHLLIGAEFGVLNSPNFGLVAGNWLEF